MVDGARLPGMAQDEDRRSAEWAEIHERHLGERERVAAISDQEWAAERDNEVRLVREWAATRRRSAA